MIKTNYFKTYGKIIAKFMAKMRNFAIKQKRYGDIMREYYDKCMEHKHALIFLGGIATAVVGKKILEAETTKNACTNAMAKVLAVKSEAEEAFQDIKDNAEDIALDAKEAKKEKILVDVADDE